MAESPLCLFQINPILPPLFSNSVPHLFLLSGGYIYPILSKLDHRGWGKKMIKQILGGKKASLKPVSFE